MQSSDKNSPLHIASVFENKTIDNELCKKSGSIFGNMQLIRGCFYFNNFSDWKHRLHNKTLYRQVCRQLKLMEGIWNRHIVIGARGNRDLKWKSKELCPTTGLLNKRYNIRFLKKVAYYKVRFFCISLKCQINGKGS